MANNGSTISLKPRTDRKNLSKALTRMPHSNVPQNRDPRPWKHRLGPLSKITNGRVDYAFLRQEASDSGIVWPPTRNVTSPLYKFFLPVGKKIGNNYWLQCLFCNSDPIISKLNLMNRHFFGVGPSSCQRLEPFSSQHQSLFNYLKRSYLHGTQETPTDSSTLNSSFDGEIVSSSTHTDSEELEPKNDIQSTVRTSVILDMSTIDEEISSANKEEKKESLSLDAYHTIGVKKQELRRKCYSPQRTLKIHKFSKRKHRRTFPFDVPGDAKVITTRKLLVHFGVSMGISMRYVENFFNKLIRKISPFTPNISASTLEQTTLPQLGHC